MIPKLDLSALRGRLAKADLGRNPRTAARAVLAVLLAANVAAAVLVYYPPGGSPETLESRMIELQRQVQQKQAAAKRGQTLVSKVEKARQEGDQFIHQYFLPDRSESSSIAEEITRAAKTAGVKVGGHSFSSEPIEGSATLSMLSITASYEGTYADLMELVNLIDRSPRFLTIETLTASPQQTGGTLSFSMKINTFVRQDVPGQEARIR